MKKLTSLFLILCLLVVFAGCQKFHQAEEYIDHKLDVAEDQAEKVFWDTVSPADAPVPAETNSPDGITETEAKSIALEHAGVTEQEASRLQVRTDWDNGRQEYDVEFHVEYLEYEYEIDAVTGKILSFDKDH